MKRLTFILLLLAWGCNRKTEPVSEVLLVTGGTILTSNVDAPEVACMAIANGRIISSGSEQRMRKWFPDARIYNLEGRTVVPGIVDSHVHVHEFGQDQLKADLTGAESVAEMVTRLRSFYPRPEPGAWLLGQGWDEGVWASRGYPDRAELDAAFPENPVVLESLHGFAGFYNGQALATAGINRETPDPEAGQIQRRKDGEASGVLLTLAQDLVTRHIPKETVEQARKAILTGLEMLSRAGVTSVHEAGTDGVRLEAFSQLAAEGALPIRVYALLNGNDDALMEHWFARGPLLDPDVFFTVRGIKVFYDGSLGSRTALLGAPYSDKPDEAHMTERISLEKMRNLAERAAEKGFQMAVHAIGDKANRKVIQLYSSVLLKHRGLQHRWRIEHAQVLFPEYYSMARSLKIVSSMQPAHAVSDSKWAERRLGPERILHAYAPRNILAIRGFVALNSDLPGEPWTPMETLYFAVTRKDLAGNPPGGWYPDQALSVDEALTAMTYRGAYAAFQDRQIGRLTPGHFADFIELDRNPRNCAPDALKDIVVLRTWVAGKPLWEEDGVVSQP